MQPLLTTYDHPLLSSHTQWYSPTKTCLCVSPAQAGCLLGKVLRYGSHLGTFSSVCFFPQELQPNSGSVICSHYSMNSDTRVKFLRKKESKQQEGINIQTNSTNLPETKNNLNLFVEMANNGAQKIYRLVTDFYAAVSQAIRPQNDNKTFKERKRQ